MEIFWGCVLEVIIFISPKFEHLWICFDPSIVKISKGCVLVNALDSVSGQHRLNRRLGSRSSDQPVHTKFGCWGFWRFC